MTVVRSGFTDDGVPVREELWPDAQDGMTITENGCLVMVQDGVAMVMGPMSAAQLRAAADECFAAAAGMDEERLQ